MTFEAPDTVPMEAVEDGDSKRKTRDLGAVAVGTVGFAASGAIEPDATSAAMDDAGQPFADSLDVFDTLQPENAQHALPKFSAADPAALSSIYGAQSTAGGGFTPTEPDPDLDFAPIDFTTAEPSSAEPVAALDMTTGATSFTGGGQPAMETPEFTQPLDEPLTTDIVELDDIHDDDDDGDGDDLGS